MKTKEMTDRVRQIEFDKYVKLVFSQTRIEVKYLGVPLFPGGGAKGIERALHTAVD